MHEVAARLANTRWSFLAVSVVLNLASIWVRAWRWYYLFPPGSQPSHLFNALMIGYMGNNLLPLRAAAPKRSPHCFSPTITVNRAAPLSVRRYSWRSGRWR